ncbi:hypothetical protein, partial [Pseudomonas sp. lyk4-R2A-10]|uniref:hypothetical protein n=1 Tax=Pseudomonas sp. lyk4-R2A-10 TaxID=3040315 RepID=UPI002555F358
KCRTPGQKPFGSFLAFEKVTRCKSETASGSSRSNGYTPKTQAQAQNPDKQKRPALSRASCIDLISERGK